MGSHSQVPKLSSPEAFSPSFEAAHEEIKLLFGRSDKSKLSRCSLRVCRLEGQRKSLLLVFKLVGTKERAKTPGDYNESMPKGEGCCKSGVCGVFEGEQSILHQAVELLLISDTELNDKESAR